ncbi:hypothetical protein FUAX_28060 [Fulvitalea axinellae]|uniref:DUF115 domain-containing protein n=1 Tax=Fulvitalea axinellae TaxID=1182444 RepID=A0AAU9CV54_9BACT|nr:hypothetical protein FUAX_28060 [Fulvitalea axinellae]
MSINTWAEKQEAKLIRLNPAESLGDAVMKRIYLTMKYWKHYFQYIRPNKQEMDALKALRGSKKGKSAFILAGGPSLKKLDYEKVARYQREEGFEIFGINSFISKIKQVYDLRLDYAVFSDPRHFGLLLDETTEKRRAEIKEDIKAVIDDEVALFAPMRFKGLGKYRTVYHFPDFCDIRTDNVEDITKPLGYYSLSTFKALSIALYCGYDTIYLCGLDNDYFKTVSVNENNEAFFEDNHFYDDITVTRRLADNPIYKRMGQFLFNCSLTFEFLEKFSPYNIVNLDKEGLVSNFTKKHNLDIYRKD